MFSYVLIAIGLILVAVSFFISEKTEERFLGKKAVQPQQTKEIWSEKDEKNVSERIEAILSEKANEALLRTEDQLSRISNEKIMAVSEFSDQLLEKLDQNHSEVIFLYNMLGEKEDEIKKLVSTAVKPRQPFQPEPEEEKEQKIVEKTEEVPKDPDLEVQKDNQKEQILKLYEAGGSVLEISRELGIGQGEVKLVLDLFQEVKQ